MSQLQPLLPLVGLVALIATALRRRAGKKKRYAAKAATMPPRS